MRNIIKEFFSYDETNLNDFDYATMGSLVVGVADVVWLTHDILANGFGSAYSVVGTLLLIGNIMAVYGLHIHHKRAMHHRLRRRQAALEQEYKIRKELEAEFNGI